jgi:mannose PTS system EIIA component
MQRTRPRAGCRIAAGTRAAPCGGYYRRMAVGILLVTHPGIGNCLHGVAERLLGRLPLAVRWVEVPFDAELEQWLPAASRTLREVDSGGGVLLLTDLYGASPSNFAARLATLGVDCRRVAGLSLPMLLRALNYPDLELGPLADATASGGRLGVVSDHG